jgi:hypothetical protein
MKEIFPHHCAPEDVASLVKRLEWLQDPEKSTQQDIDNQDIRTLMGMSARVIKYLRGEAWMNSAG